MSKLISYALSLLLLPLLLGGCASNVPKPLQEDPPDAPSLAEVHADPQRYVGKTVRWGGEILGVRNESSFTEVEIYGRSLFSDGEPRPEGGDRLRFIAKVPRFLDPAEYKPGKRLTVRGEIAAPVNRMVGEYPYRYPVVEAGLTHLWPVYEPPVLPRSYVDPYYDPWWPWGPWHPWGPYRHWPYWY
jgi:outer membrane lipoprotein